MTVVWKLMLRPVVSSWLWAGLACHALAGPLTREAPNLSAVPANQLTVAGNACGPAALLNAFRFGNSGWQRASNAIPGTNDRERILNIIGKTGMRPSEHVPGHARWSRRGISVVDLTAMANEMCAMKFLPRVTEEVIFLNRRETQEALLRRAHRRLETSLAKGLPPLLSIRRYALRRHSGKPAAWSALDAHFVTIIGVPRKLDKNARSFPVSYIDPWGGRRLQGTIVIPTSPTLADGSGTSSCLVAVFPETVVGKKLLRAGEKSALVVSAAIGRW